MRERGGRVAIDSSGASFAAAVAATPHLIKPNHEELAELVGHDLPTLRDVRDAARELVSAGIEVVAVSLGGDGALVITADVCAHAIAPISAPLSTVGAGDCMLAGLLHGLSTGHEPADALVTGVTWGSAAVTLPGSRVPSPADLDGIRAELTLDPDLSRATLIRSASLAPLDPPERNHHVPHHRRAGHPRPHRCRPPRGDAMLGERLVASGRCTDLDTFIADVRTREETMATGLPGGIGIPHARSTAITEPSLVFGRSANGIDWGAKDGPATLIFLIAAPEGGGDAHMQMLPKLARALMKKDFKAALAAATTEAEVVRIVSAEVELDQPAAARSRLCRDSGRRGDAGSAHDAAARPPRPQASAASSPPVVDRDGRRGASPRVLDLIGVTSCPTGIAHTYMAAEGLEDAAKAAGHTMMVETQGSAGSKPLTAAEIAAADAVIFAHDLPVKDAGRFAGKPTSTSVSRRASPTVPRSSTQAAALAGAEWRADPSKAAAAASRRRDRLRWPRLEGRGWGQHRHQDPPVADDRCLLHDPVRRRRRHPHRPVVHARPGRARRAGPDRDREVQPHVRRPVQHRPELQRLAA